MQRLAPGTHGLYQRFAQRCFLPGYQHFLDEVPETGRIVDLGCGPGDLAGRMQALRPGAEVHGVDVDPRMVRRARRRHPDVRFVATDARDLPFRDGSVQLATASESYHHWRRPSEVLREARRVLAPGGQLWVVETRADMTRAQFRQAFGVRAWPGLFGTARLVFRCHGYTDAALEAEVARPMRAAGFTVAVERAGAWARVRGRVPV